MEQSYWIISDTMIFKPEFNSKLDVYKEIITQYKKIIFSNYNDPEILLETNNNYNGKYFYIFKESLFNQQLSDSFSKLVNLEQLTFGKYFNHPLTDSLSNLINLQFLTFGIAFNHPLTDSLSNLINLQKLTFGMYFNQPLSNSLSNLINLEQLTFGMYFNIIL